MTTHRRVYRTLVSWDQCVPATKEISNISFALSKEGVGRGTYRHVRSTASGTCVRLGVHQSAANAKIAQLYIATLIDQNVGGLHVTMDDAVFVLQIGQCIDRL